MSLFAMKIMMPHTLNRKAMKNIMTISNLQNQMKIMITKV